MVQAKKVRYGKIFLLDLHMVFGNVQVQEKAEFSNASMAMGGPKKMAYI